MLGLYFPWFLVLDKILQNFSIAYLVRVWYQLTMLYEMPLLISVIVILKASPLSFQSLCKRFHGFKHRMFVMDTSINRSILLLIISFCFFTSISFRHCDLISCSCLRFNRVKHKIFYFVCTTHLLNFILFFLYWMQSTVAEFCSWKMVKVEIDLIVDEKRKSGKKMICMDEIEVGESK